MIIVGVNAQTFGESGIGSGGEGGGCGSRPTDCDFMTMPEQERSVEIVADASKYDVRCRQDKYSNVTSLDSIESRKEVAKEVFKWVDFTQLSVVNGKNAFKVTYADGGFDWWYFEIVNPWSTGFRMTGELAKRVVADGVIRPNPKCTQQG